MKVLSFNRLLAAYAFVFAIGGAIGGAFVAAPAVAEPVWFEFESTLTSGQGFHGSFTLTDRDIVDVDPASNRAEYLVYGGPSQDVVAASEFRVEARQIQTGDFRERLDFRENMTLNAYLFSLRITVDDGEPGVKPDSVTFVVNGIERANAGPAAPSEYTFEFSLRDDSGTALSPTQFPEDYADVLAMFREPEAAGFSTVGGRYSFQYFSFRSSESEMFSFTADGFQEKPAAAPTSAELMSSTSAGNSGNGTSWEPTLSADGLTLAFSSDATDLTADSNGAVRDIYLSDRRAGTLRNLTDGANGESYDPVLSKNGEWLAFVTKATNLPTNVPDSNGVIDDIVLFEVSTGDMTLVTPTANAPSSSPSLSFDGQRLVFDTLSNNLARLNSQPFGCSVSPSSQLPCYSHVVLYDRVSDFTLGLTQGGLSNSRAPVINEAGDHVAFISRSFQEFSSLGSAAALPGIIVMNLDSGERVFSGISAEILSGPAISSSGLLVAATSLGDESLLYVRDFAGDSAAPRLVARQADLPGEFSGDETKLFFSSTSRDLDYPDTNGAERDIYALDVLNPENLFPIRRVSSGGNGPSGGPVTNADGTLVAFDSAANNFSGGDSNGSQYDVFLLDTSEPVSQRPIANSQEVSVPEGDSLNITLTGYSGTAGELRYEVLSDPLQGALQGTPPDLVYIPAAGFSGRDGFSFEVSSGDEVSEPGFIGIEVQPSAATGFTLTAVQRTDSRVIDIMATWPADAVWTQVREFEGLSSVLWDGQAQTWTGSHEPSPGAASVTFNSRYWLPGVVAPHENSDVTVVLEDSTSLPGSNGIGGYVWFDADGDTLRSSNEAGEPNRVVSLYRCEAPWGIAATAVSQTPSGRFDFGQVAAGGYQIGTAVPSAGFVDVAGDNAVHDNGFSNCFSFTGAPVEVSIGLVDDAATPPPSENTVAGFAWVDANRDGLRQAAEPADSNRVVTLFHCAAPWGEAGRATTDAQGRFMIGELAVGEYQLGTAVPDRGFAPRGGDNDVYASGFTNCVSAGPREGEGAGEGAGEEIGIGVLQ